MRVAQHPECDPALTRGGRLSREGEVQERNRFGGKQLDLENRGVEMFVSETSQPSLKGKCCLLVGLCGCRVRGGDQVG